MTYAALMVYVDKSDAATARIELACNLAKAFDAALIGVSGSMPEPPPVDPYSMDATYGEVLKLQRTLAETDVRRAEVRFDEIAGARGGAHEWRGMIDDPARLLVREGRAADLLIVGRDAGESLPAQAPDPGDVLMSAGRPVLVVPPGFERNPFGGKAIVAWKDGTEARRAVRDALPFLRAATQVSVVEIAEHDDVQAAHRRIGDVIAYLRRHGVEAVPVVREPGEKPAAQHLLAIAAEKQAGLIVMGGYGHARLREWTFGGVTRELLKTSSLCLLLSH